MTKTPFIYAIIFSWRLPFQYAYYEILEDKLGREEAKQIVHEMEASADALATQKKVEVRDELSKELASKSDLRAETIKLEGKIDSLEERINRRIDNLRADFRMYFMILVFLIILVSPRAMDLIGKLLGIVK